MSAEVSLAILWREIGTGSRLIIYFLVMASSRPTKMSIDQGSETCKLAKKARAGFYVVPEDSSTLAKARVDLKHNLDPRERLGKMAVSVPRSITRLCPVKGNSKSFCRRPICPGNYIPDSTGQYNSRVRIQRILS
jgi:hypothetical protein